MEKFILASKIVFFMYIVLSPFINHKYLVFLDNLYFKILFIIFIAIASFVDLDLSIILTLALLILVINFQKKPKEHFNLKITPATPQPPPISYPVQIPPIVDFPDTCSIIQEIDMSEDLMNHYIDPKIKPYENYIRQLSSKEHIEDASGII